LRCSSLSSFLPAEAFCNSGEIIEIQKPPNYVWKFQFIWLAFSPKIWQRERQRYESATGKKKTGKPENWKFRIGVEYLTKQTKTYFCCDY